MLPGVNGSLVAVPPLRALEPRLVPLPSAEQSGAWLALKQVKNSTEPVTVPLSPVSVATSVTDSPLLMTETLVAPCLTCVWTCGLAHSSKLPNA